jgi:AAA family ATP:ADP antiporter
MNAVGPLARLINARPHELSGAVLAFLCAFFMFTGYTILRPIRETMGITSGVDTLPALFWGTFAAMLLLQPVYGWLASRFRRTQFLPWVYLFFILNLVGFHVWFNAQADHTWIARAYFIWVSVFVLFVVAVFWSLMADVFSREQAGRLFGFIAAGLSVGGLAGPFLGKTLAEPIGTINLLLVAAAALAVSLVLLLAVTGWHRAHGENTAPGVDRDARLGGHPFAAFRQVLVSPYLASIALFVFLLTWISTFLYLEQQALVARHFTDRDVQTRFFNTVDFWVQAGSLFTQVVLFGRLFRIFGFRALIVSVPVLMVLGFATLAMFPAFGVLVGVFVIRRIGEYSITRPSRDTLYTVVSRDERYKAKSLIDTFIYRLGDATSASAHALLKSLLGLGLTGIAWCGAALAALWAVTAWWLGTRHAALGGSADPAPGRRSAVDGEAQRH